MLHRAARNAYSWWWASHIRTKQLKWLEQNVKDMEEKVEYVLNVINEDGDSFMIKADMFFRKRPELVNLIQDCLQGYRALARRYDKLSMVMQNANRTIASAFPHQMHFNMDDDFDDDFVDDFPPLTTSSERPPPKSLPTPPLYISTPNKSPRFRRNKSVKIPTRFMSNKGLLKLGSTNNAAAAAAAAAATNVSGLSKTEALVEIDRLQKGILALQTEKEFVKSSYENGLAKCLDIENQVTLMQADVNSLQDEFCIEKAFEDDEARMLMAATALNSCQEKITTLQDIHDKSIQEAKGESKKLYKVRHNFETMIQQLSKQKETKKSQNSDQNRSIEEEIDNLGTVNVSLKEQLQVNDDSTLTVTILAEKIDELVDTVLNLESAVSSQGALVKRLRSESNELQEKLQSLEVDKETLNHSSDVNSLLSPNRNYVGNPRADEKVQKDDNHNSKVLETEPKLRPEQSNNHLNDDSMQESKIEGNQKNKNSQNMFKDGSSSIGNSADKVQNVESHEPPREVTVANYMLSPKKNYIGDPRPVEEVQKDGNHVSKVLAAEPELQSKQGDNHVDDHSMRELKMKGIEKNKNPQNVLEDGSSSIDNSVDKVQNVESLELPREVSGVNHMQSPKKNYVGDPRADEEVQKDKNQETEPDLQSKKGNNHVDDHSMQELKMKGNEICIMDESDGHDYGTDEKHQPNWRRILLNNLEDREKLLLEEYTSLLRNFKQLKKKLNDSEKKHRANLFKSTVQLKVLKSTTASKDAEIQSLHKKLNLLQSGNDVSNADESREGDSHHVSDTSSPNLELREPNDILQGQVESIVAVQRNDCKKYDSDELELATAISSIEEKIRMDLDEVLEENIEFWLKYSTSFHQVEKFEATFEDLQAELSELNESKQQEGSSLQHSDVRPIYMHLREIQTELALWLEQNVVLEDDLQNRISSISSIEEEISRSSNADSVVADDTELTDHQAAKFTGEVMNMKHQNFKVADELLEGIESVKKLKVEIGNAVAKLDREFGFSGAKNQEKNHSRSRIPLRSFLFGTKLKKQKGSLLARIAPRQQSDSCELHPTLGR